MTDFSPTPPPAPPSLGAQLATLLLRHALGAVGAWLVARGYLGSGDIDSFTTEAVGVALVGLAVLASFLSKLAQRSRFLSALWSEPPGTGIVTPPTGGTSVQPPPALAANEPTP